jgi:hypothetical protein
MIVLMTWPPPESFIDALAGAIVGTDEFRAQAESYLQDSISR